MSQNANDTVQEQGNLEAHELLMITDAVQCSSHHITRLMATHFANVGFFFLEQVKKWRNKFSRTSSTAPVFSQQAHSGSKLGAPRGKTIVRSEDSQWCHKARDHDRSAVTK